MYEQEDPIRVLVVDDDPGMRRSMERLLTTAGMNVALAADGGAAVERVGVEPFDVVLADLKMPGITGAQLLERVRGEGRDLEVVIMTAETEVSLSVQLVEAGAFAFLMKPFASLDAVVIAIRNAAQVKRLRSSAAELRRELPVGVSGTGIVGSSPLISEVRRLISGVAAVRSTVLILGESGTGKELVARAIHARSTRGSKPFVAVNCGAIPSSLVESELFGHTRGAFTSALAARAGLFEAAHGGTLFLDEVGELPLPVQVKLLRTLELGEVRPVGSDTTKKVDVRVIAATNADLRASIAAGSFRQDLFYRLNVIAIRVPPLRERADDAQLLALHFIRKHAQLLGRELPRLSRAALAAIAAYSWPGNVRELEHAIERAIILSPGTSTLDVSALPPEVRGEDRTTAPVLLVERHAADLASVVDLLLRELGPGVTRYQEAKRQLLAEFNRAYVAALLEQAEGNVTEAARLAGLDRSNFRRLMRAIGGSSKLPPSAN